MTSLWGLSETLRQVIKRSRIVENPFWDSAVYLKALSDISVGIDPYSITFNPKIRIQSPFPYHPYILELFKFLSALTNPVTVLATLELGSFLYFIHKMTVHARIKSAAKNQVKQMINGKYRILFAFSIVIGFCVGGSPIIAIFSGNVATSLHLIILGTLIFPPKSWRAITFSSFWIILASLIKPYFLAYLLLFYVTFTFSRAFKTVASVFIIWFSIWCSAGFLIPIPFQRYIQSIDYLTDGIGDFGFSIFGIFRRRFGDVGALTIHTTFLALLIILLAVVSTKLHLSRLDFHKYFFPAMIYIVVFSNPRMHEYDFGILPTIFLAFILINYSAKVFLMAVASVGNIFFFRIFLVRLNESDVLSLPGNLYYLKYWEIVSVTFLLLLSLGAFIQRNLTKIPFRHL